MTEDKISIPLNDPRIHYDGVLYPVRSDTLVVFNRFSAEVYNHPESGINTPWLYQWVATQTGIRIRFRTASPHIHLSFEERKDGGKVVPHPFNGFTVFGDHQELISFSELSFIIRNPDTVKAVLYEVVLPNLWAVNFKGMELDHGYELEDPGFLQEPVYIALGTSISHGTGQYTASARSFPFILARESHWNLFNLAVAGSMLGWAIALETKAKKADYITIELGFNDWKYLDASLENRREAYHKLLLTLREYHPQAKIWCISPIVTTDTAGAAPYSLDDFRKMVEALVTERQRSGDTCCYFADGLSMSDPGMLDDGVHLNERGAALLAERLSARIHEQ